MVYSTSKVHDKRRIGINFMYSIDYQKNKSKTSQIAFFDLCTTINEKYVIIVMQNSNALAFVTPHLIG